MSLVFVTMFFLVFDVLIHVDDIMAGPILGLKFLDPWYCHIVTTNTVYHRLQYLLPGESVKMVDTTRSGVSQTFFSKAFNECLPSKRKEFVFKYVFLLSMCVCSQNSCCMLHTRVKYASWY